MLKHFSTAVLSAFVSVFLYAHAVPQKTSPGSERYSPTRIDWLTTMLQANLRDELTLDRGFSMDITFAGDDPDTVLIYVRYLPDMSPVEREIMNMDMATARTIIEKTAKRYGWEDWVKIKEHIELAKK